MEAYTVEHDKENPSLWRVYKDNRPIAGPGTEAEMRAELKLIEEGEL